MAEEYKGEDRRQRDHDLLLELKGILLQQNEVMKNQKDVMSSHVTSFNEHVQKDERTFISLFKKIDVLQKYVWIGVGIIGAIEFASKVFHGK